MLVVPLSVGRWSFSCSAALVAAAATTVDPSPSTRRVQDPLVTIEVAEETPVGGVVDEAVLAKGAAGDHAGGGPRALAVGVVMFTAWPQLPHSRIESALAGRRDGQRADQA